MIFVRSLLYAIAFYVVTAVMALATLPVFFLLPQSGSMAIVRSWARTCLYLLGVITGTRAEIRGRENIPRGGFILASKHQSAWETLALFPLLASTTMIMKKGIRWYPIFGQYTMKAGMIHIDRQGKGAALKAMTERAREELGKQRQIVIFPEGTRRPPGAPPQYHSGVALLYRSLSAPVVPVALNSGFYWPKRSFFRYPGTIILEFLPPIEPGLDSRSFLRRLESDIEAGSDRLLVEADQATPRPPFPPEATARLAELR